MEGEGGGTGTMEGGVGIEGGQAKVIDNLKILFQGLKPFHNPRSALLNAAKMSHLIETQKRTVYFNDLISLIYKKARTN